MNSPLVYVRITNPSSDPNARLDVRTIRQDVAPGEPASLMGSLIVYPGEEVLLQVPPGAAIVVAEEGTLNG